MFGDPKQPLNVEYAVRFAASAETSVERSVCIEIGFLKKLQELALSRELDSPSRCEGLGEITVQQEHGKLKSERQEWNCD